MNMELTEEKSLNNSFKNQNDNNDNIELIFRNQMSEDTKINFPKGNSFHVSDIKKNEEFIESISKIY